MENQLDNSIKSLRYERSGTHLSSDFDKYLLDNKILSQLIASGMPQQKGIVERKTELF